MGALFGLALMAAVASIDLPSPAPQSACTFSMAQSAPDVVVKGPDDILSRLRIIRQPDSPVVVAAVDLTEMDLVASTTSYSVTGSKVVELLNVSDRRVSDVRVTVWTRWSAFAGGGHSSRVAEIGPGERAVVRIGGRGQGTAGKESNLTVDVLIDSLKIGDCVYKPSQLIPELEP